MVLGEFLKEIKKNPSSVKFAEMANILVIHCQTTGECVKAQAPPPPWQLLSLTVWESPGGSGISATLDPEQRSAGSL